LATAALLALADGNVFYGTAVGCEGHSVGEVVFNTAMTGYQEILTDPSYSKQLVALTYPHIGNTGTNPEDVESNAVMAAGLIMRDLPRMASNWRNTKSLQQYLSDENVVAIADIDTRALTRILRDKGAQPGCIVTGDAMSEADAIKAAQGFPGLAGMDLAKEVTAASSYAWNERTWTLDGEPRKVPSNADGKHVVAMDFGVKQNILRMLTDRGCRLTVVPATATADEIKALSPDGLFLSNGPGDPEPCDYAIQTIKTLVDEKIPTFGICLGRITRLSIPPRGVCSSVAKIMGSPLIQNPCRIMWPSPTCLYSIKPCKASAGWMHQRLAFKDTLKPVQGPKNWMFCSISLCNGCNLLNAINGITFIYPILGKHIESCQNATTLKAF